MVVRLSTFMLLFVLSSVIYGTNITIEVLNGSGSLQLSSFPDRVAISGVLDVIVNLTGRISLNDIPDDLPLNIVVADSGINPVYRDLNLKHQSGYLTKTVPVIFSSSSKIPLLKEPVPVRISVSFAGTPVEVTSNIIESRVGIGFLPQSEQIRPCHPKKDCALSVKISHSTTSFDVTIDLLDSNEKTVNQTTFTVEGDKVYHPKVIVPKLGLFMATLSVVKNVESSVYWSRQRLQINVVADISELEYKVNELINFTQILWKMYQNLSDEYEMLKSHVDSLPTSPADHACEGVQCGDYGTCIQGKCNCTYPWIYGGDDCQAYVGCDNNPCGSRGPCVKPLDIKDVYVCNCNEGVIGKNCTECEDEGYCNEPNGICLVNDTGKPQCTCYKGFKGDNCELCTEATCQHGGNCNGTTHCVCAEGYFGATCDLKKCSGEDDCGDNGICINSSYCQCDHGYMGDDCHEICSDQPCGNGGNCSQSLNDTHNYECKCHHGYSGGDCKTHICTSENPCKNNGDCEPDEETGYKCKCYDGFSGRNCETVPAVPSTTSSVGDHDHGPTPIYQQPTVWAIAIFIVVLVICVLAYIGYHNRNKIFELFGGKKETVVEMAMRSRTRSKGYKKLPTSIHDTLTHED